MNGDALRVEYCREYTIAKTPAAQKEYTLPGKYLSEKRILRRYNGTMLKFTYFLLYRVSPDHHSLV